MYVNIPTIRCLIVLSMLLALDWNRIQYVMGQTPPGNDVCTDATVVSPLTTVSFIGNFGSNTLDTINYIGGACRNYFATYRFSGVWYVLTNPTSAPIEYVISTDFPETTADTDIGIFSGTCTGLICVGGNDDVNVPTNRKSFAYFTAAPQVTYYVVVLVYSGSTNYKVSFSSTPVPTNPPTNIPTTSPTKQPTNTPTMSPTKQPTNIPTTAPTKQPTNTPTMSPTNTPTLSPTNEPTKMPSKSPSVYPTSTPIRNCDITYNLYNSRTDQLVTPIMNHQTITNSLPPCGRYNIEAVVPCGVSSSSSNDDSVVMELYRGTRLYARRTEYYVKYFLFGNNGNNIYDGRIAAGAYSIRTIVDGNTSPFTNFTIGSRCK